MDELLAEAAARAITYLRERDAQDVFPGQASIEGLSAFVEALSDEPTSGAEVLRLLDEVGSPGTVASTGGRYFGFVTGGSHPVGVGASWLASAWDQNAALGIMSPTVGVLDTVVGAWLLRLLGLPGDAQHHFVAGTTAANTMCLAIARDRLFSDQGWDSVNDGLAGAPPLTVVVSEAAHSSVTKALGFVGLGRKAVVQVPADDQGRLIASRLPAGDGATLVIAQAGNVNSGSCDPFHAIAEHYAGSSHWIHVDGAFGLWAGTSRTRRSLVDGVDRAHSWATDLHKWLNTTYDSAIAVVADRADMARTFQVHASYLPNSSRLEPLDRGPDMSQRARSIEAWAVVKSLGATGIADLSDRLCDHAERLRDQLVAHGVSVVNEVVLNQVLVALETDEDTEALVDYVQGSGVMWCGGSRWNGRSVMRISISSWATTEDDVDLAASTILGFVNSRATEASSKQ